MAEPTFHIADDRKTLDIAFETASLSLTTDQVDALIAELGRARSMMTPDIPKEWESHTACRASRNPAWMLEVTEMMEGVLLHIRDPRFGWMHYAVPIAEAKNMGLNLTRLAERVDARTGQIRGRAN